MSREISSRDLPEFVNHSEKETLLPKLNTPFKKYPSRGCCVCIPARFVLTLWTLLGLLIVYALRTNLSIAIVSMVKTPSTQTNSTNSSSVCPMPLNNTNSSNTNDMEGEFDWDDKTRGIILGAFFYGYIITQVPGGLLAERFGGKWLFGVGTLITSIATVLTPFAARLNVPTLITVRFIAGLGEGVTFPSYLALYSHWVPYQERSTIIAITNSGCHVGNIIAMPATAWLCEHGFSGGWPSVFYVFGVAGCLWFGFWVFFVTDRPENYPCITSSELQYIVDSRKSDKKTLVWSTIPWKNILTSYPVWALAVTKFGTSWAYYTMMTEIPTFLNDVLNYPIKENGNLNSFMYIAAAVSSVVAGTTSDIIRSRGYSITTVRKIYQFISTSGCGVVMACIPSMGCYNKGVIALLITSMVLQASNAGGDSPAALDMSPEYVGIVFGLVNTLGNVSGFLAPLATGLITSGDESHRSWNTVFYLASAINGIGGVAFLLFGSANLQSWSTVYNSQKSVNCDQPLPASSKKK